MKKIRIILKNIINLFLEAIKSSPEAYYFLSLPIEGSSEESLPVPISIKRKSYKEIIRLKRKKAKNQRTSARASFWNKYRGDMSCGYCKQTTSRHLPENHPLRATIEHIIPLSEGGNSYYKNLMLACYECNQLEGAKNRVRKSGSNRSKKRLAKKIALIERSRKSAS